MSPVLNILITVVLILAALSRLTAGLSAAYDTAAFLNETVDKEYQLHLCGSAAAAAANLGSAAQTLTRMYPEETETWQATSHRIIGRTRAHSNGYGSCDEDAVLLHQQSPGRTPSDLPNTIYRLPWPLEKNQHG